MQIPVLIEAVAHDGYRVKIGEPLPLTAEGPTRELALENLRKLLHEKLRNTLEITALDLQVSPVENPWRTKAGMFKDDPYFDEWQQAIAENRRKMDADPDIP